jgi:hypothetical protein
MPYIRTERRDNIYNVARGVIDPDEILSCGDLNYAISLILSVYLANNGTQYRTFNDIVGALECAKSEFIRRIVNPYEDQKIISNGDIY